MKELEKFLNVLSDGMRTLAQGVEGLAGKVDELAKTYNASTKPQPRKTAKKPTPPPKQPVKSTTKPETATDAVLVVIKRHKKGVNMATLKEKTGFDDKKIYNIVYKLKKKGLIKTIRKGVYIMA